MGERDLRNKTFCDIVVEALPPPQCCRGCGWTPWHTHHYTDPQCPRCGGGVFPQSRIHGEQIEESKEG